MKESTFKKYCLVVDEWFVNGFNGTKAYLKFYPDCDDSTARVNFSKILTYTNIEEYVTEKQTKTSDSLQITLERQIEELEELKDIAKQDDKINDAINALKEQSKLLGLYEKDNTQKKDSIINNFSIKDIFKVDNNKPEI